MKPAGGALLVDKPVGPTSHDIVAQVRKAAGTRRVGHAGTLDPFASGLLLVLLGTATRLSEYLLGLDKAYVATARLGMETTTCDPEGEVLGENEAWRGLGHPEVEAALASFQGEITQEPPAFSSKKIRGEAAHRRARRGEVVEMKEVGVTVHHIQLLDLHPPAVTFGLRCSSGTYIRALGRDLGRKLGVGAYLTDLRRTGIGGFSVEDAVTLSQVQDDTRWRERLLSPAQAVSHLPAISVGPEDAGRLRHGQDISSSMATMTTPEPGNRVRVLMDGELVAIGMHVEDRLKPRKVFGAS